MAKISSPSGAQLPRLVEWLRASSDLVFIILGVVPIVFAAARAYLEGRTVRSIATVEIIQ